MKWKWQYFWGLLQCGWGCLRHGWGKSMPAIILSGRFLASLERNGNSEGGSETARDCVPGEGWHQSQGELAAVPFLTTATLGRSNTIYFLSLDSDLVMQSWNLPSLLGHSAVSFFMVLIYQISHINLRLVQSRSEYYLLITLVRKSS